MDNKMSWLSEIKKVGFANWLWFVFWLRRDEFSAKLDLDRYYPNLARLTQDRILSHEIDMALSERPALYDRRTPSGIVDKSPMT